MQGEEIKRESAGGERAREDCDIEIMRKEGKRRWARRGRREEEAEKARARKGTRGEMKDRKDWKEEREKGRRKTEERTDMCTHSVRVAGSE